MAVQINGEDDQNLYRDLVPLLPGELWPNNRSHPSLPFPQNPTAFIVEDSPDPVVLPASYLTNINPALLFHPSFNHLASSYSPSQIMNSAPFLSSPFSFVGMIPEPDDIAPVSHNHHRETVQGTDVGLNPQRDNSPELQSTVLVPVDDTVPNGSRRLGGNPQGDNPPELHSTILVPVNDTMPNGSRRLGGNPQGDNPPELQSTILVPVDDTVPNGSRRLGGNPQGDNPPELHPTILVPVGDPVHNGSQAGRASRRDILQETPQLRFLRLMEVNRSNAATALGARTGSNHPDTNPDTLMSNILALEAARREKLKNERENGTTSSEKKNDQGCQCRANFECNICFETSVEPVVTQCGHLFCWRCLYKWISMQLLGISECPVCKGEVTDGNVTPIYGRGGSSSANPVPGEEVEEIPPRPSGRRTDSTRQLIRREREINGRGYGSQDVQRVRTDLEAVLARLRQMPRQNRATSIDVASDAAEAFAGTMRRIGTFRIPIEGEDVMEVGGRGEVRAEGDGPESEPGSSVAGEIHVRRRRRYR